MQWIEISIVCERVATDEVTTLFDDYADNGIIEEDIEKTIRNVGIIGTTGMEQTDKTILNIMCRKQ